MKTVTVELQNGAMESLRRLTTSLNEHAFNPQSPATTEAERPYSIHFTGALLRYSHGNASEAETLSAIQVEDASVLPHFCRQLDQAARKIGVDQAGLVELQSRLSQSEASASVI